MARAANSKPWAPEKSHPLSLCQHLASSIVWKVTDLFPDLSTCHGPPFPRRIKEGQEAGLWLCFLSTLPSPFPSHQSSHPPPLWPFLSLSSNFLPLNVYSKKKKGANGHLDQCSSCQSHAFESLWFQISHMLAFWLDEHCGGREGEELEQELWVLITTQPFIVYVGSR